MQNSQEVREIAQKLIGIAKSSGVSIRSSGGQIVINQKGAEYKIDANRPRVDIDSQVRFK